MPLVIEPDVVGEVGEYGDIVTIKASDGSPARDWRTGIAVPPDQRFVLTRPAEKAPGA